MSCKKTVNRKCLSCNSEYSVCFTKQNAPLFCPFCGKTILNMASTIERISDNLTKSPLN